MEQIILMQASKGKFIKTLSSHVNSVSPPHSSPTPSPPSVPPHHPLSFSLSLPFFLKKGIDHFHRISCPIQNST